MATASRCAVKGCINNTKNSDYSFFRFPKDVERAKIWTMSCRRFDLLDQLDVLYYGFYRVCAAHFRDEMFTGTMKCRLQRQAVPTIFPPLEDEEEEEQPVPDTSICIFRASDKPRSKTARKYKRIKFMPTLQKAPKPKNQTQLLNNQGKAMVETFTEFTRNFYDDSLTIVKDELDLDVKPSISPISKPTEEEFQNTNEEITPQQTPVEKPMCHQEAQTPEDIILCTPRAVILKNQVEVMETQNFDLKQKLAELNEASKLITFEDYVRLMYKFCPSKRVANDAIIEILKAREASLLADGDDAPVQSLEL